MTSGPPAESSLISIPPYPVLRDLLAHVELSLDANPEPSPKTCSELVVRAKQVNIEAAEPWLGLSYRPEQAWDLVAKRIGDRAAAAILSGAIDLLRPFDAEPQRISLHNHGAAVAVIISSAIATTGGSRDCTGPICRFCTSLFMTGNDLTRIIRDLVETSPRHPAHTATSTETGHDRT